MVIDKAVFDHYMPLALSHATDPSPSLNGVARPGGVIPFLADDLRFILNQVEMLDHGDSILAGHLDTGRAGAFGMSLGGYVAPEACYRDQRFGACLAVAGKTAVVARDDLTQPVVPRRFWMRRPMDTQTHSWKCAGFRPEVHSRLKTAGSPSTLLRENGNDSVR